jgi:adenylate cyclase
MTEPKSLWEDLKERRVFRAVLLYALVGWGAFQVTESVAPVLELPDWVTRLVLYLLLLGFPIVAGLAWAFDVTSKGVKSAEPGGRRVIVPVVGASMLAVAIGAYTLGKSSGSPQPANTTDPSRFAVAPFRASVGPELSYLGEGMVDLLSIRLAEESGVSAVDPASMFAALKGTEEPRARAELTAAATRLGAGRLLSGGIVGDRRRLVITAALTDVEGKSSPIPVRVSGSLDSISVLVDRLVLEGGR